MNGELEVDGERQWYIQMLQMDAGLVVVQFGICRYGLLSGVKRKW